MLEIMLDAYPSTRQWVLAIRGMRNPYKSWAKSDSCVDVVFTLGDKDLKLAKNLIKSGPEHAKFLRQLPVIFEIKAPMYWWKQMDQYKVGTTTDSESTMHKLVDKEFSPDDFSFEAMDLWEGLTASVNDVEAIDLSAECPSHGDLFLTGRRFYGCDLVFVITDILNAYRNRYLECVEDGNTDGAKLFFNRINELLPQSYNQTRTWSANYAVLFNICAQRAGHKLEEWEDFIEYVLNNAPYFKTLCFDKLCQISPAFNKRFNED